MHSFKRSQTSSQIRKCSCTRWSASTRCSTACAADARLSHASSLTSCRTSCSTSFRQRTSSTSAWASCCPRSSRTPSSRPRCSSRSTDCSRSCFTRTCTFDDDGVILFRRFSRGCTSDAKTRWLRTGFCCRCEASHSGRLLQLQCGCSPASSSLPRLTHTCVRCILYPDYYTCASHNVSWFFCKRLKVWSIGIFLNLQTVFRSCSSVDLQQARSRTHPKQKASRTSRCSFSPRTTSPRTCATTPENSSHSAPHSEVWST